MYYYITVCLIIFAAPAATQESVACTADNQYIYKECECLEFVIDPQVLWDKARGKCIGNGGDLVMIQDIEKQEFITDVLNKISGRRGVWIGIRRNQDRVLQWVDGTPVSDGFQYWAENEPNPSWSQLCGMIHVNDGWKWKDYFCGVEDYSYICQYELKCGADEEANQMDTNIVIGIVVGSVIGLICFFALVFFLINCCRDAVRAKRNKTPTVELREVETGSHREDGYHTSDPMIPPPEKSAVSDTMNDLDRASVEKNIAPLITANVVVSASTHSPSANSQLAPKDSVKISNLAAADVRASLQDDMKRKNSLEDNYLAANTDTDDYKTFSCSKEKL